MTSGLNPRVNDCILKVNNVDCRDVERTTILHTLRNAQSVVGLLIRRRKPGKRYQATLHVGGGHPDHGLTLDLGVYVARIQPGSAAAKEGTVAVGDRIVSVRSFVIIC